MISGPALGGGRSGGGQSGGKGSRGSSAGGPGSGVQEVEVLVVDVQETLVTGVEVTAEKGVGLAGETPAVGADLEMAVPAAEGLVVAVGVVVEDNLITSVTMRN